MFANRLFSSFVAVALVVVAALTIREAVATTIVVADHSYGSIEQLRSTGRAVRNTAANREYDVIEQLRVDRTGYSYGTDRRYDPIELLRTQRLRNPSTIDSSYHAIEDLRVQRDGR